MCRGTSEELPEHSTSMSKIGGLKNGDVVLKEIRAPVFDPRGKFKPSWGGPYIIKEILPAGAVRLMDLDGIEFARPTNLDQLKKYYV